ncbi:GNAT family N-acetyltransferase [Agrococcus terreus]|uniref:GNAT family N-acetyltransferase n=1 Tax=Agrococcus terreus TaxID=574649 RepID=A0ABQ2KHM1_9MICO|nr:GNAT family N-acetyltransferase [Agrococcus terreus]GGN82156.1 GNAT family N-acetyltransferase [Agrococcus terreus]
MRIEIVDVPVPEAWDDDSEGARLLRSLVDVRNAVVVDAWGGDASHAFTYREAWAQWRRQEGESDDIRTVALLDGEPVGRGYASRSLLEATEIAEIDVMVRRGARGRGVGTALADDLIGRMRSQGATTFQSWVDHHPAPGPTIAPPTGFGAVPADSPQVRMLRRYGFALEQIERMSELRLGDARDGLADLRADAERHALPRYRAETWSGATPTALAEQLAALHARMSTDAPSAGLASEPEVWDLERLQRYEASQIDGGRTLLRAVAVEEASGEVIAFTTLTGSGDGSPWYQHDTLVHGDHRGHRLGMLVKAANLLALDAREPGAVVRTWNAEENRPMLAVNEALGFVAICSEGVWQRKDAT